ncbi:hypothetical protein VSAK1_26320 [Vibrio mediterranei AK1]|uniref:phage tail assembly chaperone n=1 Tax=Vibrio mediterranei TaxID=689 RepID=UPI000154130E|nr:hypothetical protein [Vibrio mediterranei]EDL53758.1 hypothetical protein VSAK1_26320 [Vibrio mediterranei AK1]
MKDPFDNVITTEIDGKKYQAYKLKTSLLLKHGIRLSKVLIPVLNELSASKESGDMSVVIDLFLANIDEVNLEELLPLLLKEATVDGRPLNYEEEFRGDFMLLVQVAIWLITENFLPFIKGSTDMNFTIPV